MASRDPAPRQSRISPSVPSLTPVLDLAKGTKTAQMAVAKPGMKNAARVACWCVRALEFAGVFKDMGLGSELMNCDPRISESLQLKSGGECIYDDFVYL
jgi:hypothetical protein